ncbi:transaldolase family protein [Cryobacterium tagatosivorans]|uniref:Transaldolase n=1 Tax=Cryobacterium tagatosivorans TaxID=1259199 RepID=A0A4R8UH99_9MICO|nr:transaldolase family protein [Cryobacterium tagatosivorans]TFB55941.1 transaldolase [Cryobacterium tagatosivorans]
MNRELRFYADSANVEEVSGLLADGLVHGVTTNPTILARGQRSVRDIPELYARWEAEGAREIFFQAWGDSAQAMIGNAERLAALGSLVVVKVPATRAGFTAAAALVSTGASVLVTAVYAQAQALAAATIGVRYIAPYLGRLNDAGREGVAEISAMQALVQGSGTDVLAASLRTPDDIVALAQAGVPFFTAAPSVILAALHSEVSDRSAEDFEAAVARGLQG